MNTIDEVRRKNLSLLAAQFGGVSALATLLGKSTSQISQWANGSANSGTGKARGMRSSSCREIERGCGKPEGWMDVDQSTAVDSQSFDVNVIPSSMGVRAVPVISAVQAGTMKEITSPYAPGDGFSTIFVDSGYSKWVFGLEIEGNSMEPDFKSGDLVIIDPELEPRPGDCVVAKNCREEATFKKYRQRGVNQAGETVFELVPLNPDYPTMRSDETHLQVIGVMVEYRRKINRR